MVHKGSKKASAIELRRQGKSLGDIEAAIGVSKSTLSGWLKSVRLTKGQSLKLHNNWMLGLVKARKKAALYHSEKKLERFEIAKRNAGMSVDSLVLNDVNLLKLALAMLFAGEGFKVAEETSLGNSDPKIVLAFLKLLENTFGLNKDRLRLYLHLRADQNVDSELDFWSNILEIEPEYFKIAPVDKRTVGKQTYKGYHGVCVVRYYDVSIKRELLAIADSFFVKLAN